jgi:formate hydrogenlyase subunit 3/multisubunit Na+/H+ antiporter MnhD subunit
MGFFLFVCLSSLALPPLNGFIGEFLILIGTFMGHHAWASWAASGSVLSAIYLLWAYQRVGFGEITVEKNRALPDASRRERVILVTMSAAIIFMGIASPLFTHRMEASVDALLQQTNSPQDARRAPLQSPATAPIQPAAARSASPSSPSTAAPSGKATEAVPVPPRTVLMPGARKNPALSTISYQQVRP